MNREGHRSAADGAVSGRAKVIFFGTPPFAVTCLRALSDIANVALVVTQPDKPSGRGLKLTSSAVKVWAEQRQLPVIQPKKIRTQAFAEQLRAVQADVGVVVAYGRILPLGVLEAPRLGCVNIHASLLPKYRGAAPIQWSILNGEKRTGVCLMEMDEGMDTGPVLAAAETDIHPDENAGALSERLSQLGAELLARELPRFVRGELAGHPQNHALASMAPLVRKEHGQIDWHSGARRIHDLVRAMSPWPGAFTWLGQRRVKLHRTLVMREGGQLGEPGTIMEADRHGIQVACSEGVLAIADLQLEGKRRMSVEQFLAGHRLAAEAKFETLEL